MSRGRRISSVVATAVHKLRAKKRIDPRTDCSRFWSPKAWVGHVLRTFIRPRNRVRTAVICNRKAKKDHKAAGPGYIELYSDKPKDPYKGSSKQFPAERLPKVSPSTVRNRLWGPKARTVTVVTDELRQEHKDARIVCCLESRVFVTHDPEYCFQNNFQRWNYGSPQPW